MEQKMEINEKAESKGIGSYLKRFLPLAVLAVIGAVIYTQGWYKYISIEQLAVNQEFLQTYIANNFVFALLIYMGIYIVATSLSFPGATFLTLAGGLLFGWIAGGIATVLAATIGATIVFVIAKTALGETLASKAGPFVSRLADGFKEDAFNYLLFLRLVPVFPFWLVNIVPGLVGVRLATFFTATLIGIIPGTFAYIFVGVGLDSVIDAQLAPYQACLSSGKTDCAFQFSPKELITTKLIVGFVVLGIVSLIPIVLKKLKKSG